VASDGRNAKEFAGKRAPGCIINSSNGRFVSWIRINLFNGYIEKLRRRIK